MGISAPALGWPYTAPACSGRAADNRLLPSHAVFDTPSVPPSVTVEGEALPPGLPRAGRHPTWRSHRYVRPEWTLYRRAGSVPETDESTPAEPIADAGEVLPHPRPRQLHRLDADKGEALAKKRYGRQPQRRVIDRPRTPRRTPGTTPGPVATVIPFAGIALLPQSFFRARGLDRTTIGFHVRYVGCRRVTLEIRSEHG